MLTVLENMHAGSDIRLRARFTVDGTPVNPSSVSFVTYRDNESTPIQGATDAESITDDAAILVIDKANTQVADGRAYSKITVAVTGVISGSTVTKEYVFNLYPLGN